MDSRRFFDTTTESLADGPDVACGSHILAGALVEPGLPPALGAERFFFGGVQCYIAGHGPPLVRVRVRVRVHSVNAASSAAEVRPIFEH
jgi:hypothetical protein